MKTPPHASLPGCGTAAAACAFILASLAFGQSADTTRPPTNPLINGGDAPAAPSAPAGSTATEIAGQNAAAAARNSAEQTAQHAAHPGTVVNPGINPGVSTSPPASSAVSGPNPAGVEPAAPVVPGNVAATASGHVVGATGTPVTSRSGTLSASLNSVDTVNAINTATRDTRDPMLSQVEARLSTAAHAAAELHRENGANDRLGAAYDALRTRGRQLRSSLQAARGADAGAWSDAQAKLAADYQAYAEAMTATEAAAGQNEK